MNDLQQLVVHRPRHDLRPLRGGGRRARSVRSPGVAGVDVDLDSKLVTVRGEALDRDAIVAAIDEAGYDVV